MKARIFIILFLCTLSFVSYAQEISTRSYIGLNTEFMLIRGSMDGQSYFETDDEIILVPKLSAGMGVGVCYGFRMDDMTFDFAFYRTIQDYYTEEDAYSGRSSTNVIRYLGFKRFLYPSNGGIFEPYFDFDLSVIFMHFDKVSYGINSNVDLNSANYSGLNFGFGMGALINLSDKMALNLLVLPEFYMGTDIRAKHSERYSIGKFSNFYLNGKFGLLYYLR